MAYTPFIDSNGKTWAWGYNTWGNIGDNSSVSRCTPVAVCGGHTFCFVQIGIDQSYGIEKTGKLWTWGFNGSGQLGDYTSVNRLTPVAVCGNHTFCQVVYGTNYYALGIDKNGKAWGWGRNTYGQLGTNRASTSSACTPIAVCGNHTFCFIHASYGLSIAIDNHGKAWAWGYNNSGGIGNNASASVSTPVAVCGSHTFCKIFAGDTMAGGMDIHGKAWSWGDGYAGGRGDNINYYNTSTPVAICGNHTFCDIMIARSIGSGIDNHGQTWIWCQNTNGDLGINSVVCAQTPVTIYGNHTFCKITWHQTGSYNSLGFGIDKSGVMWAWGNNQYGNLGDNSIVCRSTPVAIYGSHIFYKSDAPYVVPIKNILVRHKVGFGLYFFKTG